MGWHKDDWDVFLLLNLFNFFESLVVDIYFLIYFSEYFVETPC